MAGTERLRRKPGEMFYGGGNEFEADGFGPHSQGELKVAGGESPPPGFPPAHEERRGPQSDVERQAVSKRNFLSRQPPARSDDSAILRPGNLTIAPNLIIQSTGGA